MVDLRIDALTSVALSMLKPIQPPPSPTAQASTALTSTQSLNQGLAQSLFQQTLQTMATPATDLSGLGTAANLDSAAALLASLSNPPTAATTNLTSATQAATSPATAPVPDLQASNPLDEGLTQEAATMNATRFGAGVGAPGTAAPPESSQSNQQIRDASSVVRLGALQAEGSHPGPEAYPQPKTPLAETLHAYQAAAAEARKLDLSV